MSLKNFRFTTSGSGYNGALCIVAQLPKKDGGRHSRSYRKVQGLQSPNYEHWNDSKQMFMEPTPIAIQNNQLLHDLQMKAEDLLKAYTFADNAQFFEALFNDMKPSDGPTLAQFVSQRIEETEQDGTGNYQTYVSLLNNLLGQDCKGKGVAKNLRTFQKPSCDGLDLADTPLSEIGNKHLAAFAMWIKDVKDGKNYRNLNVNLRAVMRKAQQRGLNSQSLTYKFKDDAPKKCQIKTDRETALTPEELNRILALQGKNLSNRGGKYFRDQTLYLDACILMYYTLSRDMDVLSFRADMIKTDPDGRKYLIYIPLKKRNYPDATKHTVKLLLCDQALAIIEKYKGQSKGGYLLPFKMNDQEWDISDPKQFKNRKNRLSKAMQCVNKHLKKIAEEAQIDGCLTMYWFRRSVITHLAMKGCSLHAIAKQAGTSLKMLADHYLKDLETVSLFEAV